MATLTAATSGILQKSLALAVTASAFLALTVTVDAVLQKPGVVQTSAATAVLINERWVTSSGVLRQTVASTVGGDAELVPTVIYTNTAAATAFLAPPGKLVATTAVLLGGGSATMTADASLSPKVVTRTTQPLVDAVLMLEDCTATCSGDATLVLATTTYTLDTGATASLFKAGATLGVNTSVRLTHAPTHKPKITQRGFSARSNRR